MSDLENELLGLAEDDPHRRRKKKASSSHSKSKSSSKGPKSKAYIEDSDNEDGDEEGEEEMDMDMDMDMDIESEEGDDEAPAPKATVPPPAAKKARAGSSANKNPYPLEGKYIDEDDREELEGMPEIERENILATRLEELQKYKDSQQLDMMYKMAGMGGDDEEEEEEDDEDERSRKRRKHTSVTKEASRAMKDLKTKRKALDERTQRRAARREKRHRSTTPASDSHSTEDGEISARDISTSFRRRSMDRSASPEQKPKKESGEKKEDLDAAAPNWQELNSARLSRYEIVDLMFKDGFEEVAVGAYVRLMAADRDPSGRPKYRVHRIASIDTKHDLGRYSIEYKGRSILDNRALLCAYGNQKRLFRIADVSNGDFDHGEFDRFTRTNEVDKIKAPKRSELKKKHDAIKDLRDRAMTNEEISRQVESRKQSNPMAQRSKVVVEITGLVQARNLALRRDDRVTADDLARQIIALGGDPSTGHLVNTSTGDVQAALEEYDNKIQRINENNKKRTKEQMAAAHQASIQRKKAEEAIVKAKQAAAVDGAAADLPKAVAPPVSGLKKGETPQQYVARTIELDLGDF